MYNNLYYMKTLCLQPSGMFVVYVYLITSSYYIALSRIRAIHMLNTLLVLLVKVIDTHNNLINYTFEHFIT